MEVSWETLTKKYNVKIPFINYLRYIGFPFLKILKKLKVSPKLYKKFENEYKINSLKNLNFIKIHKGVLKTFKLLKKKKNNWNFDFKRKSSNVSNSFKTQNKS